MSMCAGPSFPGTVSRKKSPNPMRYMRTRMLVVSPVSFDCTRAELAGAFAAAFLGAFLAVFAGVLAEVLAAVFRGAFTRAFAAAFDAVFLVVLRTVLRVAIIRTPRAAGQSWPESDWDLW